MDIFGATALGTTVSKLSYDLLKDQFPVVNTKKQAFLFAPFKFGFA